LRQLEDARYDRMLQAFDDRIRRGDLAAIDRALRISKARRELWGLDAPVQIQAEVSPALAALLQQWQGLRETPPPPTRALPEASDDVEGETVDEPRPLRRLPAAPGEVWRLLDAVNRGLVDASDHDRASPRT
jgi:hypothetical protein